MIMITGLQKVINTVRLRTPGTCLPKSVVARDVLHRLGEPSVVMAVGLEADHFYLYSKSFGVVDVFPEGYKGILQGYMFDPTLLRGVSRNMLDITELVFDEVKHEFGCG